MSLGTAQRPAAPAASAPVPPATRATRSGWRDPRLWIGLLIVAASVVAGARLLAAADDTVAVWAVASDAGPGARLDPADLVAHRVRFVDAGDLAGYYTVDDELPSDLRLVHAVGAGELLPRDAVGTAAAADTVELPVAVDAEQVPPSVASGSVVDVYLIGHDGPLLREATVVDAPPLDSTFGATTGRRQLVLAVAADDAAAFLADLGRAREPVLTVVRRG
ncbi:hypothetical protein [Nocardioides sp. URHA0032]|uniref:hypothetical protein n=1 Tax=Nocardioides sp. URHA0032 TaxID=1380388 RepID=UPI000688EE5F|nr:hypothetical protein [Nocardioides sp. URHA0032]